MRVKKRKMNKNGASLVDSNSIVESRGREKRVRRCERVVIGTFYSCTKMAEMVMGSGTFTRKKWVWNTEVMNDRIDSMFLRD